MSYKELGLAALIWVAALTTLALALPWIGVGYERYSAWVGGVVLSCG